MMVRGKRVRILVVTDGYFPSRAACAVRMKVLVETLRGCGDDVQVLASDTSLAGDKSYVPPDYVHFFPVAEMGKKTIVNRLKNNLSGSAGAVRAARGLGHFDVVLVTSPPILMVNAALKIAKAKRAKLVFDVRDIWPDVGFEMGSFAPGSVYGRVFGRIATKAYKASSLITTVSEGKAEKIRSRIPLEDAEKVQIVANGLDLSFTEQTVDDAIITRFGLDKGKSCVYVGNIGLAQGLDNMLELAKSRPEVNFLLFGEGASKDRLEEAARSECLDNVSFCGTLDSRGVYSVLSRADASYVPLVNSNLSDSIPTKMFESIGCGCPVLLAASGDSVRVLEDIGLGLSAAPEDVNAQLDCLDRILAGAFADGEKRRAAAYVRANYSRQAEGEKLSNMIHSI